MYGRRQDQNFNLREFDALERLFERSRNIAICPPYLQCVEAWKEL